MKLQDARPACQQQYPIQRRHIRYRLTVPIHLDRRSGQMVSTIPGVSIEISEGGMSAIFPEKVSVGEKVELYLNLPQGSVVRMRAVVRHNSGFRHGFEFIDSVPEQVEQIRDACELLGEYTGGYGY